MFSLYCCVHGELSTHPSIYNFFDLLIKFAIKDTINNITKIKKTTFAISAAATATPVKPNIPAIIEMTRKVSTHSNIAKLARLPPKIYTKSDKIKKIKKRKKIIFASWIETTAIPVNPNIPAMTAIIKNISTHDNINYFLIIDLYQMLLKKSF